MAKRPNIAAASSGASPVRSTATSQPRKAPSPMTFFQESRAELRKVTWPTRQEATNLTIAVIGMTAGLAAFLGLVDGILDRLVKPIIGQ